MKARIRNLLLILTSFIVYLEWGKDQTMFLLQGEVEILKKLFTDPTSVLHPFTVIPLLGQILLTMTLFQKQPSKKLTIAGVACLGVLITFIFLIGLISVKLKMLLFSTPFMAVAVATVLYYLKPGKVPSKPHR